MLTALTNSLVKATVILVYAVLVFKALLSYPILLPPTTTLLVIKTILIITLFAGNYLGGALVYKHGIGIETKNT